MHWASRWRGKPTVDAAAEIFSLPMCTHKDETANDALLMELTNFLAPLEPVLVGRMRVLEHGCVHFKRDGVITELADHALRFVLLYQAANVLGGPPWLM